MPEIVARQLDRLSRPREDPEEMRRFAESREVWQAERSQWSRQRPQLDRRVDTARARSQTLLERPQECPGLPL